MRIGSGSALAAFIAVLKSVWAIAALESAVCSTPFTIPGGNPVTAIPGLSPRSPVITVRPVLVTVAPDRAAKLAAEPRGITV